MSAPKSTPLRAAVAAAALAVLPLSACGTDEADQVEQGLEQAGQGVEDAAGDVAQDVEDAAGDVAQDVEEGVEDLGDQAEQLDQPDQEDLAGQIGQPIQLDGQVEDVIAPGAVTIGGGAIWDDPILVVSDQLPADITEGTAITVDGTVVEFQMAGVEENFDLDFSDDQFGDYIGEPAVEATSVTIQ